MQFQTAYNYDHKKQRHERNHLPSMTIPDQSLTVSELVERNRRGLPLGGAKVPIWQENPETEYLPDIEKLDLAEIQEMKENVAAEIKEKQEQLQEFDKKRKNHKMRQLEIEIEQLKKQVGGKPDEPKKQPASAESTNTL